MFNANLGQMTASLKNLQQGPQSLQSLKQQTRMRNPQPLFHYPLWSNCKSERKEKQNKII
jgi:hypothetical protein